MKHKPTLVDTSQLATNVYNLQLYLSGKLSTYYCLLIRFNHKQGNIVAIDDGFPYISIFLIKR